MDAETQQAIAAMQTKIAELESRLADAEQRIANLNNMQVAEESGGGFVSMRGSVPIIRINALTPSGVQLGG